MATKIKKAAALTNYNVVLSRGTYAETPDEALEIVLDAIGLAKGVPAGVTWEIIESETNVTVSEGEF